jgi:hypothetical protein
MTRSVPGSKTLFRAQKGFRVDFDAELLKVSRRIGAMLVAASSPSTGIIPKSREDDLSSQAGEMVANVFTGSTGGKRSAFASDGVTALAIYPRLLNKWYVYAVSGAVRAHEKWMKRNVPADVFEWLRRSGVRKVSPVGETENPFLKRDDESLADYLKRFDSLRIFTTNTTARYDPMHTWVDPNGYRLSRRIWRVGETTRLKIDAIISEGIRNGTPALQLARQLEQFLLPERRPLRTRRPYGTDASADAMRLARTEISRAYNESSYMAAVNNPYVARGDVALSPSHPRTDICDSYASIGMGGTRLRPPYPLSECPIPPFHPHCICFFMAALGDSLATVTAQLRGVMQASYSENIQPYMTPASGNAFIEMLIGQTLWLQFQGLIAQLTS